MRLNPRQRWNPDRTSTVAGVIGKDWAAISELAHQHQSRPEKDPETPENVAYRVELARFIGDVIRSVGLLAAGPSPDWLELTCFKIRCGRADEITIIARNYQMMRSFLTVAALGWYERHRDENGARIEPDPRMFRAKLVLDLLDTSLNRRENDTPVRDLSLSEILTLPWKDDALRRRREEIESDIRFRKYMAELIAPYAIFEPERHQMPSA